MQENGVDIVTISKTIRHSSVKITSDQYIDSTLVIKQRAIAAMDNILGFAPQKANSGDENVLEK